LHPSGKKRGPIGSLLFLEKKFKKKYSKKFFVSKRVVSLIKQ
jgi:hypothetical protein